MLSSSVSRALASRTLVMYNHAERVIVGFAAAIRNAEKRVGILVSRLHHMRFARVAAVSDRVALNERRELRWKCLLWSNHSEQNTRAPVRAKSRARCREGSRCVRAGRLEWWRSRAYAGTLRRPPVSARKPPKTMALNDRNFCYDQSTLMRNQLQLTPQVIVPNSPSSETIFETNSNLVILVSWRITNKSCIYYRQNHHLIAIRYRWHDSWDIGFISINKVLTCQLKYAGVLLLLRNFKCEVLQ